MTLITLMCVLLLFGLILHGCAIVGDCVYTLSSVSQQISVGRPEQEFQPVVNGELCKGAHLHFVEGELCPVEGELCPERSVERDVSG